MLQVLAEGCVVLQIRAVKSFVDLFVTSKFLLAPCLPLNVISVDLSKVQLLAANIF